MRPLSDKQVLILSAVRNGVDGDHIDLDQLVEQLIYKPSKASMQFSIRALIKRGLIEKLPRQLRRGSSRVLYVLTRKGRTIIDPSGDIITEEFED